MIRLKDIEDHAKKYKTFNKNRLLKYLDEFHLNESLVWPQFDTVKQANKARKKHYRDLQINAIELVGYPLYKEIKESRPDLTEEEIDFLICYGGGSDW